MGSHSRSHEVSAPAVSGACEQIPRPEPEAEQPEHVPELPEVVEDRLADPGHFLRPGPGPFEHGEVVVRRIQQEREAEDRGPGERGHEDDGAKVHESITKQWNLDFTLSSTPATTSSLLPPSCGCPA